MNTESPSPSEPLIDVDLQRPHSGTWWSGTPWPGLVVAWALLFLLRFPFWSETVLGADEALLAGCGELMKAGAEPYIDFYDTKPPGLLSLYWLGQVLSPWSLHTMRILLTLTHCGTAFVIAWIAYRMGHPTAGALAAILFALSSSAGPHDHFQAAQAEGFMVLFTSLGFWTLLRGLSAESVVWAVAWGLCGCLALAMKQPGVFDFLGVAIAVAALTLFGHLPVSRTLRFLTVGVLSGGLALGLAAGLFAWRGSLQGLIYCCWTYGWDVYRADDAGIPFFDSWNALNALHPFVYNGGVVCSLLTLTLAFFHRSSRIQKQLLLVAAWSLAALAGATFSGRNYQYYFVQTLPANCLIVSLVLVTRFRSVAVQESHVEFPERLYRIAIPLVVVMSSLSAVYTYVVPVWRGARVPENVPMQIGKFIRANSRPEDRIFVWGFAPRNYFYAQRLPACCDVTGDFSSGWDPETQRIDYQHRIVTAIRSQAARELYEHQPAFIVDYSNAGYVSHRTFPELAQLIQTKYRLVRRFNTMWWGNPPGTVDVYQHIDHARHVSKGPGE